MKTKTEPTQARLYALFNKTDRAVDYADVVFLLTADEAVSNAAPGINTVVDDLAIMLKEIRSGLHEMVEWAGAD